MIEPREWQGSLTWVLSELIVPGDVPVAISGAPFVQATTLLPLTPRPTIGYSVVKVYEAGQACGRYGSLNQISFERKPTVIPFGIETIPCRSSGGGVHSWLCSSKLVATTSSVMMSE